MAAMNSSCFNPTAVTVMQVRWHMFKQLMPNHGVEKLFPTMGAINQHILRAHYQTNIWAQDTVAEPTMLDSVGPRWHEDNDGTYIPTVTDVPSSPEAVA